VKRIGEIRMKMAIRERELILVFREIMYHKIRVPENYFIGDKLVKSQDGPQESSDVIEEYSVPLPTFWIPTTLPEYRVDPKTKEATQFIKDFERFEATDRGKFQAPVIKEYLKRDKVITDSDDKGSLAGPNKLH